MPSFTAVAGNVFAAANYNANVRDQVVTQCTSGTRPAGIEGQTIFETDTDRFLVCSTPGTWIALPINSTSIGRVGGSWSRAATQSMIGGATTAMQLDTETLDSHGFCTPPSTAVTIPAGLAGMYGIVGRAGTVSPSMSVFLVIDGLQVSFANPMPTTGQPASVSCMALLGAGAQIGVSVTNLAASAPATGSIDVFRVLV
jgi:hypothetical protein